MKISKRAFDFTVAQEVTSKAYYNKHYQRPEWPGLSSGPTIGIGYDLGQASRAKIQRDWQGLVPDAMLAVMMSCAGATGNRGKEKTKEVKSQIIVPWDAAIHVFAETDVPEWTAGVIKHIPAAAQLPPSCLGVLFDLAYNRGHSWDKSGERYREMRAIKANVQAGRLTAVSDEIKSMKRLWPNTRGLLRRCDERIQLWNYGLAQERSGSGLTEPQTKKPTEVISILPTAPAAGRTKPPAVTKTQTTVAASLAAGGAVVAKGLHDAGMVGSRVAVGVAIAAVAAALLVWYVWFRNRNPK